MNNYKTLLRNIIELFYQPTFKIFNINSSDGKNFVKPLGYFISLGITTSPIIMEDLKKKLNNSDYGFISKIVAIKSTFSEKYNDYLNVVLDVPEDKITKYESELPKTGVLLGEDEANQYLEELQKGIDSGDYSKIYEKQKLQEAINKLSCLEGDWKDHLIHIDGNNTNIFHKYINYSKKNNNEYRIGIYVTKA